jgi:AraC-like DNA-binding protein
MYPKSKPQEMFLSLFLFFESTWLGLGGIAAMDFEHLSPAFLFKLSLLFYYLTVMVLNLYFLILISSRIAFRRYVILFTAGSVAVICLFFISRGFPESGGFLSLYYQGGAKNPFSTVSSFFLAFYSLLILHRFYAIFRDHILSRKMTNNWKITIALVVLNIALSVLWAVDKTYSAGYLWHLYFLSGCFPIMAALIVVRYPEYLHSFKSEKQYVKTRIDNIDADSALAQIDSFMRAEKVYRNSEITLNTLSSELDFTPHQLSEIINIHLRKNFTTFVNFYRVAEAKEKIMAEPDKTFIDIALESGFSSITTFNRSFKSETGESPSSYKKTFHSGHSAPTAGKNEKSA